MKTASWFNVSAICLIVCTLSACDSGQLDVEPGVSLQLADYRAAAVSNVNYKLALDIPAHQDEDISAEMSLSFELADVTQPLQLDFRENGDNIHAVIVNGKESLYEFADEHIVVPPAELLPGANAIAITFIAGNSSLNRNPDYLYTLFVPDRARTAFPLFDQPDIKATYELTLDIPQGWVAMSNAPIESITPSNGKNEYQFRRTDLISSYLFSFVAGDFELVEQEIDGRPMTMLHREGDAVKVARNIDAIFELHAISIKWLENYTGIEYPYQQFGFALIPAFQYGGMEHVGAIQYRATSLFLDESPSEQQLLRRAGLIAHETAHMWFGNLVTMEWFNDVWTKEVFANFMAAKIVNPSFPEINHDLNFLVGHYPRAYSVDRTEGANPIRQHLPNLNEAGQMYGAIIYNKAPIMMRQLETILGEEVFQQGMQEYLRTFEFANATWPALIDILDRLSPQDLKAWSNVWVNTAGRPQIEEQWESAVEGEGGHLLTQHDSSGSHRVWPQKFAIAAIGATESREFLVDSSSETISLNDMRQQANDVIVFNSDGRGYALFPSSLSNLRAWDRFDDVQKGAELINLFESFLTGSGPDVTPYMLALANIVEQEKNILVLNLALDQLQRLYWQFIDDEQRREQAPGLERLFWRTMLEQTEASRVKTFFEAFYNVALTENEIRMAFDIWSDALMVDNLNLSENDRIDLAQILAIKIPSEADAILAKQIDLTQNSDSVRKLEFIAPSLSADESVRTAFFTSLKNEKNRETESWVLDALQNLHHPLRTDDSEQYLLASLELLQEIQVTGDIFFPKRWLDTTLGNYRSATAVQTVRQFLDERPDYNAQLRMKILQASDPMFRANSIVDADQ